MKYLKKFESNNSYYEEIDTNEIDLYSASKELTKYHLINAVGLNKGEQSSLHNLLRETRSNFYFNRLQPSTRMISLVIHKPSLTLIYEISKLDDEWFIVLKKMPSVIRAFKCDQLEGLIQYLKSENI